MALEGERFVRLLYGNPRQSWILDSTPWILDSRYWISDSLSKKLGSLIPILRWHSGFLELYSGFQSPGFHKQKFPGFQNPDSLT